MNDTTDSLSQRIPQKAWFALIFVAWGGALIFSGMIRIDAYGLDEGAAMALLLNWSVSDQIKTPVATFGGPDFRGLLFLPLGLYWSGSITAAKVYTLILSFIAVIMLYKWSEATRDRETALIASGLFLVCPLFIYQIDAIAIGPFLLLLFGLGALLDKKYRASPHSISSLYFLQMLLISITITLHPMGLAYPLALAWHWYKQPKSEKQQRQVWIGIGITTVIIFAMQIGWVALPWGSNPLDALGRIFTGINLYDPYAQSYISGTIVAVLLAGVLLFDYKFLITNFYGSMLLAALALGTTTCDFNWALVAAVLLLYRGMPALITLNRKFNRMSFSGQRGMVFAAIMAVALLFMQADKSYALQIRDNLLSPVDQLIERLSRELPEDPQVPFKIASEWPARTMIAVKGQVFTLPPAMNDVVEFQKMTNGLSHILFDHKNPRNALLARRMAEMPDSAQTLDIQAAGVIVQLKSLPVVMDTPTVQAPISDSVRPEEVDKSDVPIPQ